MPKLTKKPTSALDRPLARRSLPLAYATFLSLNSSPSVTDRPQTMPVSTASPRRPRQCRLSHTAGVTWMGVTFWKANRPERSGLPVLSTCMARPTPIERPMKAITLLRTGQHHNKTT